ncbi:hypothetical protein, partial [Nonomuraea sp. NPDC003201]
LAVQVAKRLGAGRVVGAGRDAGQGAVSARAYLEELPELVDEIDQGRIAVSARIVPLAEVEAAWTAPERPGVRTVLVTGEV